MTELVPVNLISGFLGAGKTTLLKRLLADPALADAAVLINEFGEVGLDHHLLERLDETMVLLPSGCICCTIRGDLADAVKALHARRDRAEVPWFRRLIVEGSGLADPFPILSTFRSDPVLRHHYRIGNVITAIDAVNAAAQLDHHPQSAKQIAIADRLVLTKTDLVSRPAADSLLGRLRQLNPSAPLCRSAEAQLDVSALLAQDVSTLAARSDTALRWFADEVAAGRQWSTQGHSGGIRGFSITLAHEVDWTAFGIWLTMLLHCHGHAILRVKGILNVAGTESPVAIHGVQHLVHPPVHMASWPDEHRHSRLVFIVDGLEQDLIERSLTAFLDRRSSLRSMPPDGVRRHIS